MSRAKQIARFYRQWIQPAGLVVFHVVESQSDLLIAADTDLAVRAYEVLKQVRHPLEKYLSTDPTFATTLEPYKPSKESPDIAKAMARAGAIAGVGPMAAVAGAIAEEVGRALLGKTKEVIVENGGDIFIATNTNRVVGVYAGEGDFHDKLGLELPAKPMGCGIATSSATIGPSLSLGKAEAATVIAETAALADACATALANRVTDRKQLKEAVQWANSLPGVTGALAIIDNMLAVEGTGFKIVPL